MCNPSKNTIKYLKKKHGNVWGYFIEQSRKPVRIRGGEMKVVKRSTLWIAKRVLNEVLFRKSMGFYSVEILREIEEGWKALENSKLGEQFKIIDFSEPIK